MHKQITIGGILAVALLVLPIINQYRILPVTFIYIYCLFFILCVLLFVPKYIIQVKLKHLIYFGYVLIQSIILIALVSKAQLSYLGIRLLYFSLVFIVFYWLSKDVLDYSRFKEAYIRISVFVSIAVLIQVALSLVGIKIALILPNLMANTGEPVHTNFFVEVQKINRRYSSFFLEPAHQAQFVMPAIVLLLFSKGKEKNRILFSVLITIGIISTTSLQGILGVGIIWFVFFLMLLKMKTLKSWLVFLGLIIIGSAVIICALRQPVIQEQIIKKVSSFNNGDIVQGTSMYRRIIYGWDCYRDFDWVHKIFGCGYDNSGLYLRETGIGLKYVNYEETGYMSGISKMFCELGLIGALMNLSFVVVPALAVRSRLTKVMLLCWLIIMFTSSNFDQLMALVPMYIILSEKRIQEKAGRMIYDTAC